MGRCLIEKKVNSRKIKQNVHQGRLAPNGTSWAEAKDGGIGAKPPPVHGVEGGSEVQKENKF